LRRPAAAPDNDRMGLPSLDEPTLRVRVTPAVAVDRLAQCARFG
jgi:hypothetical protein